DDSAAHHHDEAHDHHVYDEHEHHHDQQTHDHHDDHVVDDDSAAHHHDDAHHHHAAHDHEHDPHQETDDHHDNHLHHHDHQPHDHHHDHAVDDDSAAHHHHHEAHDDDARLRTRSARRGLAGGRRVCHRRGARHLELATAACLRMPALFPRAGARPDSGVRDAGRQRDQAEEVQAEPRQGTAGGEGAERKSCIAR